MKETIRNEFLEHLKVVNLLDNLNDDIATSAQLCIDCLEKNVLY